MDQEWGLCSPFEIIYKSYATYQQMRNIIRNSPAKKEYSQYWLRSAATNTYVPTFNAKTVVAYSLK
jgi:hypothetical protein